MPATPATNLETINISDTYYGLLHAGGVPIPSSGQHLIRDGSGTPTALRLGANCNGATICGTLSATTLAGGSLSLDTKITPNQLNVLEVVKALYPINAVIFTTDNVNPGTRSGWVGTTWVQISQGRFIAGVGTGIDSRGESKSLAAGNNTGEYNHILTEGEMPKHYHLNGTADDSFATKVSSFVYGESTKDMPGKSQGRQETAKGGNNNVQGFTSEEGESLPHNNIPPSFGLYVWQRTA